MKLSIFSACLLAISGITPVKNDKVVQIDLSSMLNGRPVTTLADEKLTTWTKGIDGNGNGDGYLTLSAALFNGDKDPHALPDEPLFAATSTHPEIKLYYLNSDNLSDQAYGIGGEGNFAFTVPQAKYKSIFLAVTSSEGASLLKIQFNYTNGNELKDYTVPDYYNDIAPGDTTLTYLVHDLAKWGNKNNMTEKDHHNIDLLKIQPNPARKLESINITKTKPGYFVLWAATGVKE